MKKGMKEMVCISAGSKTGDEGEFLLLITQGCRNGMEQQGSANGKKVTE